MEHSLELYSRRARAVPVLRRLPLGLIAWLVLETVVFVWGRSLVASGSGIALNAPPLFGRFDVRVSLWLLPVALVAVLAAFCLPRLVKTIEFSRLLALSFAAALLWAIALAIIDGPKGLLGGLTSRLDYLAAVPIVDDPLSFLSSFTDDINSFPIHVQGHPPAMVLFLWSLRAVGLQGAWWAATSILLAGASTAAAVLLAVRELAGEKSARVSAPFIVLAPAAIWVATSADALFMAIGTWGIALFVISTGRRGLASDTAAAAAGLLLGASLFLSYGLVLLAPLVASVAIVRRATRPLVVTTVGVVVVVATFAGLGFWWLDGLRVTLDSYGTGIAAHRPYGFFAVGNLAAFALALGPAVAVALSRLRHPGLWVVVAAALLAVAIADLSGLSKGEVERIWLPFVPWIMVATSALDVSRGWLGLQAASAIATGFLVKTPW